MRLTLFSFLRDPGFWFSFANIFAFRQAQNDAAFYVAVVIAFFSVFIAGAQASQHPFARKLKERAGRLSLPEALIGMPGSLGLRVNTYGVLLCGLLSLSSGAWLPAIAGIAFAIGNALASSRGILHIQQDPAASGIARSVTNAAVYYGIGYIMIGLMAGGGTALLADPLANIPALVTTCLGVLTTLLSILGLLLRAFPSPAAPFMVVTVATGINTLSGFLSGNLLGSAASFCSMCGEFLLGMIYFDPAKPVAAASPSTAARFFAWLSRQVMRPLYAVQKRS
jgi:hypothetical protein